MCDLSGIGFSSLVIYNFAPAALGAPAFAGAAGRVHEPPLIFG